MKYFLFFICCVTIGLFCYSVGVTYDVQSLVNEAATHDIENIKKIQYIAPNQNTNNVYLDILDKSNSIIGANELTFFFTFIVSVLSIIFIYRNVKLDEQIKIVEQERKRINLFLNHSNSFDHFLSRVENIHNLAILISNVTMSLPNPSRCYVRLPYIGDVDVKCCDSKLNEGKNDIMLHIGSLCSRLSLFIDSIRDLFNNRSKRIDYLTTDEKNILVTYFEHTIDELNRSLYYLKDNQFLHEIIEDKIDLVWEIESIVENIEIKEQEEQ